MKRLLVPVLLAFSVSGATSVDPAAVAAKVRDWRKAHEGAIVSELTTLLAIPNLASDTPNIERNAVALVAMLEKRGVKARLVREPGVPPLVVGDLAAPGATRTIAFYAHYDGQPVDATQWTSPPWTPALRDASGKAVDGGSITAFDPEWRVYGRSAGDDKGTIIAMVAALDALHAGGFKPRVNLKFVLRGRKRRARRTFPCCSRNTRTTYAPMPGSSATGRSTRAGACSCTSVLAASRTSS